MLESIQGRPAMPKQRATFLSDGFRSLWEADAGRRCWKPCATFPADSSERRGLVHTGRHGKVSGHDDVLPERRRESARRVRDADGYNNPGPRGQVWRGVPGGRQIKAVFPGGAGVLNGHRRSTRPDDGFRFVEESRHGVQVRRDRRRESCACMVALTLKFSNFFKVRSPAVPTLSNGDDQSRRADDQD